MTVNLAVVDLFCGAGGLTHGMMREGIPVLAGVDLDPAARYPFEFNNGSTFIEMDVSKLDGHDVLKLFPEDAVKILVGCAPCQPFSPFTQGRNNNIDFEWGLLDSFARIIGQVHPTIVSMENVTHLKKHEVFSRFVRQLTRLGYNVTHYDVRGPEYGVPQRRTRLVLFGSLFGPVKIIRPTHRSSRIRTVRMAIDHLSAIKAGEVSKDDPLHRSCALTEKNLRRIQASRQGGTWRDWDDELIVECHRSDRGESYTPVYGRMAWDEPAPTITTRFYNYGSGRFGHPEQNRAISLREAALLQTFPMDYRFVPSGDDVTFANVGRLIGNAVPVRLGRIIARTILLHLEEYHVL